MASYVLKEMAQKMSAGKRVVYPKLKTYSLQDYKSVLKKMHSYAGTFSVGEIMGVLDALITTMEIWLPAGHSLKIDGLGVFSLALGFDESKPSEQKAQDGAGEAAPRERFRHVCIKSINFKPDPKLIQRMNQSADLERSGKVRVPRKSPYSPAERIEKARQIIARQGRMTLGDYALATGLERSVASRELKRLVDDPASGIKESGTYSHKVWVAR